MWLRKQSKVKQYGYRRSTRSSQPTFAVETPVKAPVETPVEETSKNPETGTPARPSTLVPATKELLRLVKQHCTEPSNPETIAIFRGSLKQTILTEITHQKKLLGLVKKILSNFCNIEDAPTKPISNDSPELKAPKTELGIMFDLLRSARADQITYSGKIRHIQRTFNLPVVGPTASNEIELAHADSRPEIVIAAIIGDMGKTTESALSIVDSLNAFFAARQKSLRKAVECKDRLPLSEQEKSLISAFELQKASNSPSVRYTRNTLLRIDWQSRLDMLSQDTQINDVNDSAEVSDDEYYSAEEYPE